VSRRTKLVYLASLNAILASALVALATVLLASGASPDRASRCDPDGSITREGFVPVNNALSSIAEAEDFICHDIVYPREFAGWQLEQISASRSGPAAYVGRGLGFASVTLHYTRPPGDDPALRIEVSPFRIDPIAYGVVDQVEIMGVTANLIQGPDPDLAILQWEAEGFSFYAEAKLTDGFGLPDLYAILNSIK
jgi:hypothetical protein